MLDRITGLRVFQRVSSLGSLSAAARALSMSQTMATKHMAALELRLGVRLLHRTTRKLTLTDAGRSYLQSVERILADLDEADSAISLDTIEARGMLKLNAPVSFGIRVMAPLLPELLRAYPALSIDLGLADRQVDLVEEGWDLAIRIGTLTDSTLVARRLAPCPMVVCAAPAYLAARGSPRRISELIGHDCLGYTLSRSVGADRWSFGGGTRASVAVSGVLRASNGDALVMAAVAGLGIVYQPEFLVAREIEAGLLVPLELDHPPLQLGGIYALYPVDRRPPAKVRVAIDFLADRLSHNAVP